MNITDLRDSWTESAHASRHLARTEPKNENYWEGRVIAFETGVELLKQHAAHPRQALTELHEAINEAIAANPTKREDIDEVSARAHQLHDLVAELSAALDQHPAQEGVRT